VTARQLAIRAMVMAIGTALVAGVSVGAYYDVGGWAGVAAVWGGTAVLIAAITALAWGLTNWNAR
jgi:F0F1-type ATP synthase assembly protein I